MVTTGLMCKCQTCGIRSHRTRKTHFDALFLEGMSNEREKDSRNATELLMPADQQLLLTVGSVVSANQYRSGYSCYVGLMFQAKPDAQYEIQYRMDMKMCRARLLELNATASGAVERTPVASVKAANVGELANLCEHRL